MEIQMYNINWNEKGDDLDVLDCYDKEIEVFGEDEAGNEYSAVAMESCGDIVGIDKESIECLKSFTAACTPKWAKNKKQLYKDIEEK